MFCTHCSTPVPDDSKYCHQCGSLVSDAEGQAGEMERGGGAVDRHAVTAAAIIREPPLEGGNGGTLGQEIRTQHPDHRLDVILADVLTPVGDHGAPSGG